MKPVHITGIMVHPVVSTPLAENLETENGMVPPQVANQVNGFVQQEINPTHQFHLVAEDETHRKKKQIDDEKNTPCREENAKHILALGDFQMLVIEEAVVFERVLDERLAERGLLDVEEPTVERILHDGSKSGIKNDQENFLKGQRKKRESTKINRGRNEEHRDEVVRRRGIVLWNTSVVFLAEIQDLVHGG